MPVNFGILQPNPSSQTSMVSTPASGGGDSGGGLGDMLGGMKGLLNGLFGGSNAVQTANQAIHTSLNQAINPPQPQMPGNPVSQAPAQIQAQLGQSFNPQNTLGKSPLGMLAMNGPNGASSRPDGLTNAEMLEQPPQGFLGSVVSGMKEDFQGHEPELNAPKEPPFPNEGVKDGSAMNTQKLFPNLDHTISDNVNSPQAQVQAIHNAVQTSGQVSQNPQLSPEDRAYHVAQSYMGDGRQNHADVMQQFIQKSSGMNVNIQTTPWCAAFANSVLGANGIKGTGSLAAKSFLKWGQPTSNPTKGDIAVFNDLTGKNDPSHGHVAFYAGEGSKPGYVKVLGGNQSGQVKISEYPANMVAGYRRPPSVNELRQGASPQMALNTEGDTDLNMETRWPLNQVQQPQIPVKPINPRQINQAPAKRPMGANPQQQLAGAGNPAARQQLGVLQPFMDSLSGQG